MRAPLAALLLSCAACTGSSNGASDGLLSPSDGGPGLPLPNPLIVARPYEDVVPVGWDKKAPLPLVLLLHGYGASGFVQSAYWGMSKLADERRFLLAFPDGTRDSSGKLFWNATDACCDFGKLGIDDVAYLNAVIDDMSARYPVDAKRIFVTGHSNGGFMSHRLACDLSPRIAAIVSLAGVGWKDPARCNPTAKVAVLQVHGDRDESVPYGGGPGQPSARVAVAEWAKRDGCGDLPKSLPPLDLDKSLAGAETRVEQWPDCKGGAAELWTIQGGSHVPSFQETWGGLIYDFMLAHAR